MRYVNRIHSEVASKRSQHKNTAAGAMPGGGVGLADSNYAVSFSAQ